MADIQKYGLIEDGLDWALYATIIVTAFLFVFFPSQLGLSAGAPLAGIGLFGLSQLV